MCAGQKTEILAPLMKEAYSYSYSEEPRYDFIISELGNILSKMNHSDDRVFSWNRNFYQIFNQIIDCNEENDSDDGMANIEEDLLDERDGN